MLSLLAALGLAALPAAVLIVYFYRLDKAKPEPIGLIGRSVLYGFMAVFPAIGIEIALGAFLPKLPGLAGVFVEAFLVAGLVEESVKFFFLKRYIYKRPEFDERVDGIVYAICVSLGFAFVENFLYGYSDFGVLALRAFTSVPLHALASGVMGYYIGMSKISKDGKPGSSGLYRGLGWAVFIHGIYDFFVLSGSFAALLVFPLLFIAFRVLKSMYRKALAADAADSTISPYQNAEPPIL